MASACLPVTPRSARSRPVLPRGCLLGLHDGHVLLARLLFQDRQPLQGGRLAFPTGGTGSAVQFESARSGQRRSADCHAQGLRRLQLVRLTFVCPAVVRSSDRLVAVSVSPARGSDGRQPLRSSHSGEKPERLLRVGWRPTTLRTHRRKADVESSLPESCHWLVSRFDPILPVSFEESCRSGFELGLTGVMSRS